MSSHVSAILSVIFLQQYMELSKAGVKPICSKQTDLRVSLTKCVSNSSRRFFNEGESIILTLPISDYERNYSSDVLLSSILIPQLHSELKWAIILRNGLQNQAHFVSSAVSFKYHNYIIQLRGVEEFSENIQALRELPSWNPHGKFMVITTVWFRNATDFVTKIMESLWRYQVLNAVIIIPLGDGESFEVYSWYPYRNGSCDPSFKQIELIDTCSLDGSRKSSWYDDKLPKKFNKCLIRVQMVPFPPYVLNTGNNSIGEHNSYFENKGFDVNLLDLIGEIFNLRMRYLSSATLMNWGEIFDNGTTTGNLVSLVNNTEDIAIGGYGKTYERSLFLDASISYYQEKFHYCVPHIPMKNRFRNLTTAIDSNVWLLIILTYLLSSTLMWLGNIFSDEFNTYKHIISCYQFCYSVVLGIAVALHPRTFKMRFIMSLMMMFSFSLLSAYQTFLMSALSDRSYVEQIQTIDDIFNHQLKTYYLSGTKRYFHADNNNPDDLDHRILRNWRDCSNLSLCLDNNVINSDSTILLPKSFADYALNSYMNAKKEPALYCFKKSIVTVPTGFLMRKGFALYRPMNQLILNIISAGIFDKWERDVLTSHNIKPTTVQSDDPGGDFDRLDFVSLQPVFIMLLTGLIVSVLVFVTEVVHKYFFLGFFKNELSRLSCSEKLNDVSK